MWDEEGRDGEQRHASDCALTQRLVGSFSAIACECALFDNAVFLLQRTKKRRFLCCAKSHMTNVWAFGESVCTASVGEVPCSRSLIASSSSRSRFVLLSIFASASDDPARFTMSNLE